MDDLVQMILKRSEMDKNYGVIMLPEGLIEFIPEFNALISDINDVLASGIPTTIGEPWIQACRGQVTQFSVPAVRKYACWCPPLKYDIQHPVGYGNGNSSNPPSMRVPTHHTGRAPCWVVAAEELIVVSARCRVYLEVRFGFKGNHHFLCRFACARPDTIPATNDVKLSIPCVIPLGDGRGSCAGAAACQP